MQFISKFRLYMLAVAGPAAIWLALPASAAMDPRFEIDPATFAASQPSMKKEARRPRSSHPKMADTGNETSYTVKPGDHLFKILMRDYGLSNSEAEALIGKVKADNNITDIRRLKIGQKIVIPLSRQPDAGKTRPERPLQAIPDSSEPETPKGQRLVLESPAVQLSNQDAVAGVREIWDRLVPAGKGERKPLELKTANFSLTLDPQRYPILPAMDGARILIDRNGTIPPLVKSLIEEKDPGLRIISNSGAASKAFLASLLSSSGFYSVEENFSMDFGVDPKLTVRADFKVEKTSESLIKQDLVLMNAGRNSASPVLNSFLKKEGFSLYEPFAALKPTASRNQGSVQVITARNRPEMVDAILSVFSLSAERNRSLDVYASEDNGIALSVRSERYFERNGHRYVVTSFDGDPVNYTLFRILETRGYRVIILDAQDDFRKVAEKMLSRMKIPGSFAKHDLVRDDSQNYSLQMSGFKLDDSSFSGGNLFLTNLSMDRIVRDLLMENGYHIKDR